MPVPLRHEAQGGRGEATPLPFSCPRHEPVQVTVDIFPSDFSEVPNGFAPLLGTGSSYV